MASFVVSSPTGDEDVASLLEKGFQEHQEDERVMKLPWQQVVKDMKFQAEELKKWLNRINNWQLHKNLETKPERECLEQTFAAFDKAMEQVKRYELTLDTFNSEKKIRGKHSRTSERVWWTECFSRCGCTMFLQALPR